MATSLGTEGAVGLSRLEVQSRFIKIGRSVDAVKSMYLAKKEGRSNCQVLVMIQSSYHSRSSSAVPSLGKMEDIAWKSGIIMCET